jgi:hypothetical protein
MKHLAALLAAFFLLPAGSALATTYYVTPGGADTNSCTSLATPCRTIQKVANLVNPGDTAEVKEATTGTSFNYNENVTFNRGGTAGNPVTWHFETTTPSNGGSWSSVQTAFMSIGASYQVFDRMPEIKNSTGTNQATCLSFANNITGGLHDITLRGNARGVEEAPGSGSTSADVPYGGWKWNCAAISMSSPTLTANLNHDITIDGLAVNSTFGGQTDLALYGNDITLTNSIIANSGVAGGTQTQAIRLYGNDAHIEGDYFSGFPQANSEVVETVVTSTRDTARLLFKRNYIKGFTGNNDTALWLKNTADGSVIENNVFSGFNQGYVLDIEPGTGETATNVSARYNTLHQGSASCVATIGCSALAYGTSVTGSFLDNILYYPLSDTDPDPISYGLSSGVSHDFNLVYGNSKTNGETHGLNVDPQFVSPSTGNYRLQQTSPAIDASDNGSVVTKPTTDLFNVTRDSIADIGAVEHIYGSDCAIAGLNDSNAGPLSNGDVITSGYSVWASLRGSVTQVDYYQDSSLVGTSYGPSDWSITPDRFWFDDTQHDLVAVATCADSSTASTSVNIGWDRF